MTVIYIGGASAAGKTTAAQRLGALLRWPVLGLDTLAHLLRPAIPAYQRHIPAIERVSRALVAELLEEGADCIVEGGWLRPPAGAALRAAGLAPVYCGYEETTASERLRTLRSASGAPHWVTTIPEDDALAWLEEQIAGSRRYREACARDGLAYVDCSRLGAGVEALCREATALARAAQTRA